MKKSNFDSGGNDMELIAVLNAISHVSARMARNMTILAQQRQSEKGERRYGQNERYGYDHRKAHHLFGRKDNLPGASENHRALGLKCPDGCRI